MSSFWNRVIGGSEETQAPGAANAAAQSATVAAAGAVKPATGQSAVVMGSGPKLAYGIAQANDLMSTLAMGDNADLVVHVIRTTLESAGVQVGELIAEAKGREGELRAQVQQRRSTIGELEHQIEAERKAITALESELALTSRTRGGLERSEGKGVAPSASTSRRPPVVNPERDSGDSDRPTARAVTSGLAEDRLSDADIVSLPPAEPKWPPKAPKSP
jgi:hypothetical protein